MGAVVEQIQQTYDLQVNGYYSQLHLLEDSLIQEEVRSIELDRNKKFFEAWQKESESTIGFSCLQPEEKRWLSGCNSMSGIYD